MTLSKAITIGLATLLAVPVVTAGSFDSCTAVSYNTFNSTSVQDKYPQFGPKGLYSSSTAGQCIYVDATANGDFATTNPADYHGFIANTHALLSKIPEADAGLEYLSAAPVQERAAITPRSAKMMARQDTVGCGAVCNSSQVNSGRTRFQQNLLISFTRAPIRSAIADRASMILLSASKEGFAPLTIGASRHRPNSGRSRSDFHEMGDVY
ncbi:hypothetical protein AA0119_g10307 [Alternaria tenuissima]|uniref:Uncharacterized protein n=1 Tax=Alternaria tenuissima TaxID=119927 RepID=A0AB37W385_9PLEO|nr:hypothetical protein AA0115_g10806 [Alternaria tenuissima]RYN92046.1 hypothetical protein AA0119_g10307 [Alternaria tenuissima]RYO08361.1 hypothetical protein AA0121_g11396 [Alternaria tenuissima]